MPPKFTRESIEAELTETADAELSALDHLDDIVWAKRKGQGGAPMDQQEEIDQAVISAATGISIEIDRMIAYLPQRADLGEIAGELVWAISDLSDNQAFVEIFSKALAARRALMARPLAPEGRFRKLILDPSRTRPTK